MLWKSRVLYQWLLSQNLVGAESRDPDHKQAFKVTLSTQRLGITDPLSDKMQVLTKMGPCLSL